MAGQIVLCEDRENATVSAPWAAPFIALGARLARRPAEPDGRRLVVVLTVPTRDLVAVLIGTGWALTRPQPAVPSLDTSLRQLELNVPVIMLAGTKVRAHKFLRSETVDGRKRIRVGASAWLVDKIEAMRVAPDLDVDRFGDAPLAPAGSLVVSSGRMKTWRASQVASSSELVIVGTKAWMIREMSFCIGVAGSPDGLNLFGELLRPDDGRRPTWGSQVLPAARFEEAVVPDDARITLLDGKSAIGWLTDLSTEISVAIIDRSVSDDFAAESLIQLRSMGGIPVPLSDLGWSPPLGVEALAFEAWR